MANGRQRSPTAAHGWVTLCIAVMTALWMGHLPKIVDQAFGIQGDFTTQFLVVPKIDQCGLGIDDRWLNASNQSVSTGEVDANSHRESVDLKMLAPRQSRCARYRPCRRDRRPLPREHRWRGRRMSCCVRSNLSIDARAFACFR